MSEHPHKDLNDKYVRKDLYDSEKEGVKELCMQKHKAVNARLSELETVTKSINKKITATLIFTIITLVGIIVAIGTRALM
jgi:hypothetical protein